MLTDKIKVDGWGIGREEALEAADRRPDADILAHKP